MLVVVAQNFLQYWSISMSAPLVPSESVFQTPCSLCWLTLPYQYEMRLVVDANVGVEVGARVGIIVGASVGACVTALASAAFVGELVGALVGAGEGAGVASTQRKTSLVES